MAMGRPRISFKTIIPKKGFLFDLFAEEIHKKMRNEVKPDLRRMFYSTVDNWETKVYFRGTIRTVPGRFIRLTVQPYGSGKELYALVSRGASPHQIKPRYAQFLKFQSGYRSASYPRVLSSRRKQRFGDTVYTKNVDHPGFEARDFDYEISEIYHDTFIRKMQAAVEIYAKKQKSAFSAMQDGNNPRPVERR